MHPSLQQKIGELAAEFAQSLVTLLQDQPLSMLTGGTTTTPAAPKAPRAARAASGGGGRRGPEEMAALIEQIVGTVRSAPEGLRSEQIQERTGLAKREIVRPLHLALKQGMLRKVGEKRSTTYFAPGSEARGASRSTKPAAKPKAKRKPVANKRHAAKAKPKTKVSAKPKAKARAKASKPKTDKHVNSVASTATQSEATA